MYSTQESEKVSGAALMTNPCPLADVADQYSMTDWQGLASMDQNVDFNASAGLSSYGARIPQSQDFNSSIAGTRPSSFSNENFPQMSNCFALPESCQITNALFPTEFTEAKKISIENDLKGKKRKTLTESGSLHLHPSLATLDKIQNVKEAHEDVLPDSVKNPKEKDEKKQKTVPNLGVVTSKTTAKHTTEQTQDGNASKEDYIHVRAKRGQATNSHSLAERVRREKISERMRLLQDLVPGCNKITGKAVMLDEIINYVQSLQRQVEFLSMKLATVNPELNFDAEQIFLKDILHSQDGGSAILGFSPGMSSLHPHLYGSSPPPQGVMQSEMVCSLPQISTMAPMSSVWHDEMQNVYRRGFIPHAPPSGTDQNGSMKVEL